MMLRLYQRKALLAIMLAAALGAAPPRTASAGSDPSTIKNIIDEGRTHSELMKNFEYLTDVIGPRLTGSNKFKRAAEWTAKQMRDYELDVTRY
jgi:carboxypeptidase Q